MARRSSRKLTASSSTTPTKRAAANPQTSSGRQSKRVKPNGNTPTKVQVTPKKSKYFEHDPDVPTTEPELESNVENEDSGYEDEDVSVVSTPPESGTTEDDGDDEGYSEEDVKPKARRKSLGKGRAVQSKDKTGKGQELWRSDVKAGLGPGKQVIVKLPKARPAGSTPYEPHTIHSNTLLFLGDLAKNNNREWLKLHDADFRASEKDFDSFAAVLTEEIMKKDETIPELPVKDIKFRIYRDIRFSPDPTPYKPYFSAAWSRTGRKGLYAHYYVQIQPGRSFVGGGIWHPEASPLAMLRRNVDRKPHQIKKVLTETRLRKEFLGVKSNDEKKVVAAFIENNQENALKTRPKGFDADHPNINILRLRNYTIGKRVSDDEVTGPNGLSRIADLVGILTPFITYLNSVVMPDLLSSDDSSEQDEEDEAESG